MLRSSSQRVNRLLVAKNIVPKAPTDIMAKIEALAHEQGVRIDRIDRRELDELATSRAHQGVVAIVEEPYRYLSLGEFAHSLDIAQRPVVLLLDGVTDPQNFGALLRSADATGVAGVIVAKRRSAPVTAAGHKASAGATAYVKLVQVSNLSYAIDELKEMGFWVVGAFLMRFAGELPRFNFQKS